MRKDSLPEKILTYLAFIILLIFMIIMLVQFDKIERRQINLEMQLKDLEVKIGEIASAPIAYSVAENVEKNPLTPSRKYLHPEVKNFLSDETFKLRIPETQVGGILNRWMPSDPKSFNTIVSNDGTLNAYVGTYVNSEAFATRSYSNPDIWVKGLAERIEITDDFKEYTIYLKKGVKWHRPVVDWQSGRYDWLKGDHELTAKDVKFTVDLIKNPQVECPHLRNYYEDLDYVKIIDDYTVVFRWKKKTYNSLSFTVGFSPIPEFIYGYDEDGKPFEKSVFGLRFNNHWYNMKPIGCGPYEFVSYVQGASLKLKRFEQYYGEKPAINEINYQIFPDQKQNLLKIKSKDLDFGVLYPTDYREEILKGDPSSPFKNGNILNNTYDEMVYTYWGWNMENSIFKDRKVRWAMSHALRLDYMLETIFLNLGQRITGPNYIKSPGYNKDLPLVTFDLDKAAKLLDEAGWRDTDNDGIRDRIHDGKKQNFEFTMLTTSGSPEWSAAQNIYKEDLMKIGVKMNISEVDWAVMQKRIEDKDFDAMGGAWGTPWESDPYQIWHSSQASIPKSSNHISYRNPEVDEVIEELRETFDPEKRAVLYRKFHKLIYDDQPYTFIFTRKRCAVWWNNLHRVTFNIIRPHDDSRPWYFDLKNVSSNVNPN